MKPESEWPVVKAIPRVDSFEVIEVDCTPHLTDEQKNWPVCSLQPRVDSFVVIEPPPIGESPVVIQVRCDAHVPPADVEAVVRTLQGAAEQIRAATDGRFPVRIDTTGLSATG